MDLAAVPGVPETEIGPELAERLPKAPPAPWELELAAIIGSMGGRGGGRRGASRAGCGGVLACSAVVAPLVRMRACPSALTPRRWRRRSRCATAGPRCTPFMAVDSEASLVGGRRNWALPKTRAAFEGELSRGQGMHAGATVGRRATARPFCP